MSTSNKGRHRARGRVAQSRTRVGAVAVAVTSLAVVGGATVPSAPAAAAPFVLSQKCAGGSGVTLSNVNCQNSSASQLGSIIGSALPADVTAILKLLKIDLNSTAVVVGSNGTATISGAGFALAAQAVNLSFLPFVGGPGGTSTANAVTPLSAAVAVGTGAGNAASTAVSGAAVAASGSGTASAVSVGGVATAINILGIKNVSCTALYGRASADGVGSCTSVLYLFTAKNAAGSDVWTFAVADPTSFSIAGTGAVPIPGFTRDIIRVSVGGTSGITVGSDLFSVPAPSTKAVSLSSSAATSRVSGSVASSMVQSLSTRSTSQPDQPVADSADRADVPAESSTGKHRKPEGVSAPEVGFASAGTSAQPGATSAQPGGTSAQPSGMSAQPSGMSAQPSGMLAQPGATSAQPGGTSAQSGSGGSDSG